MDNEQKSFIKTAQILGYLGLLPFAAGLVAIFLVNDDSLFIKISNLIVYYAAIIIVFVSAVHWGYAIANKNINNRSRIIFISILPSLLALVCLMLPSHISLAAFFLSFIVWQKYEEAIHDNLQFPEWYTLLRKHLSYTVAALLLLTWLVCFNP